MADTFQIEDREFGIVTLRTNPRAKRVVLRVRHDGNIFITIPHRRNVRDGQHLLQESRDTIRRQRQSIAQSAPAYGPGATVGRSHQLVFKAAARETIATRVSDEKITVQYPLHMALDNPELQKKVQLAVKKALRRQAEEFLPQRLAHLAHQWGINYKSLRIMSGFTRWGSCSGENIISLNYMLMNLPDELIDYVICHELCHTIEHNHSPQFWALVSGHLPDWKARRAQLKQVHPH